MIVYSDEAPQDVGAREALLDRVFGPGRFLKSSERIRAGRLPAEGLSIVAKDETGALLGTVRLWHVDAGTGGAALLLGPLAVAPQTQGSGLGAALMRIAIGRAAEAGHRAILLVGDEPYYRRFGFSTAKTGHLAMPGPFERSRFLALELVDGALAGAAGGLKPTGMPVETEATALAA